MTAVAALRSEVAALRQKRMTRALGLGRMRRLIERGDGTMSLAASG